MNQDRQDYLKIAKPLDKSKEKCEKFMQKMKRSSVTAVIPVQRFLKPFLAFKLHSDVLFFEENRHLFTDMSGFSLMKCVNQVKHLKEETNDTVEVIFEDNPNFTATPWEYLVARLRSYGEKEAYEWAMIIENYGLNYEKTYKELLENNQSLIIPEEVKNEIQDQIQNKPAFWFDIRYTEKGIKLDKIAYNWRLLLMLGYDPEDFISKILREGLPYLHAPDDNFCKKASKDMMRNYLDAKYEYLKNERLTQVVDSQEELIPIIQLFQVFARYYKEGSLHVRNLYVMERDSDRPIERISQSYYNENVEYQKKILQLRQEAEIFTQTFYSKEYSEELIRKKVCRIRELRPIE